MKAATPSRRCASFGTNFDAIRAGRRPDRACAGSQVAYTLSDMLTEAGYHADHANGRGSKPPPELEPGERLDSAGRRMETAFL